MTISAIAIKHPVPAVVLSNGKEYIYNNAHDKEETSIINGKTIIINHNYKNAVAIAKMFNNQREEIKQIWIKAMEDNK